ncbi:MAG: sulfite exporter TauE/SafE family protein [Geodermatophilaceae bacterium]|nr:sulfite exporter TauE/SafE family protein [Geodermatophilaceae bacterium]
MDWALTFGGVVVGFVVGLTGMGGGALMTPMLVLFFGVSPLAAVSSDLVVSAIMKPFGGAVHLRMGTVNRQLVGWLCLGSVPSAFCGVLLARALGSGGQVQVVIKTALGIALILAAAGLIVKAYLALIAAAKRRRGEAAALPDKPTPLVVRPLATVIVGIVGGLVVGMTSVGSGSLIIIALIMLYPTLHASNIVGTDIVQAVPLVISAAFGHLLFGDFQFAIALSLVIGAIPGVIAGSLVSAKAPGGIVRRALALILLASALKLLEVSNAWTMAILLAVVLVAPPLWMVVRRRYGFPAWNRRVPEPADAVRDP